MALWLPGKSTNPLDRQIDLENPINDSPLNRGLVFCTGTNFAKSQFVGTVAAFNGRFTSSSPQIKTLGNDSHFFINSAATGWSSSLIFNYPALTVSCFAYLLTDGSGSQGRLMDVYGGTSYCSLLRWSGGFRCGVSTVGYPNEQSTTTGAYSNNVRYWVTAVFAGGNSYPQIYVNDVNASSASTGSYTLGTFNLNTVTLSSSSYPANGYLNHARVWNRALSANEIKEWYVEFQTGFGKTLNYRPRTKVFYAAPTTFTGSASLTTKAATASGSATFTPKFTATSAVTTKGATCSGSATFTKPVYTGTSTVTIAAATCSASGTFTKPVYSATSSVTIAAATCSATGTFVAPVYTGTSVLTVGAATASGAATFVAPVYTASAAVAVGATVVNVAGSVVSPTFTGTAAVSVPAATITATGTFSQFSQITASKPRRLNIVTHRASLNIATHAHVST